MRAWLPWLIALVSTGVCVALWFREVRRVLRDRASMVESAAEQLAACTRRAAADRCDPQLAEVLRRSESIYRQAVDHYNETLHRPWVCLPGRLMGFRPLQ